MDDAVEYTVAIRHHQDGEVEVSIQGMEYKNANTTKEQEDAES